MDIRVDKINDLVQEIRIEITKEDYQEKVEIGLKNQRKKAVIPGFRLGNAPMGMMKRMYEKPLIADVVDKLVKEGINKYIEENNLKTLGDPLLIDEKTQMNTEDTNVPFVVTFEIGLNPTFEINFDELPPIPYFEIEANPVEIKAYIKELRTKHAQYINANEVSEDDFISLKMGDKKGFCSFTNLNEKGKELFIGKKINDEVTCNIGKIFIEEKYLAEFLNLKKEEKIPDETYSGVVSIADISRTILPEMNEEFYEKAFPNANIKTADEFKKVVVEEINKYWRSNTDRAFMNDSFIFLIENIDFDLPDSFLKRLILTNHKDISIEEIEEKYAEHRRGFKWQLIENKLVKENNIQVTKEEVEDYVRNYFIQNYFANFDPEIIKDQLKNLVETALQKQEDVKNIYDQLYDMKILNVLIDKMKLDKRRGTYEEYVAFIKEKNEMADTKKAKKGKKAEKVKEEAEVKESKKTKKTEETANDDKQPKKETKATVKSKTTTTKKTKPKKEKNEEKDV